MDEKMDEKQIDFAELENAVWKTICKIGQEMTVFLLEDLDQKIRKQRDKKRFVLKNVRKTVIKTVYGEVEYRRRQYFDKSKKKYVYLLDDEMQLKKIGTVSTNLASKIADAAMELPYRKAAETISATTGQTISSHGIWNIVQKLGGIVEQDEDVLLQQMEDDIAEGLDETPVLFEEADGVYLNIQENKKKAKSQEMKLYTVYRGWDMTGKRLVGKKVMIGMETANQFNMKTEAMVQSLYNKINLRVMNGDGAAWIKNYNAEKIFQLDPFHIKKKIRECIKHDNTRKLIIDKYNEVQPDEMLEILETYINSIDEGRSSKDVKAAKDLYRYLKNNYDGLKPWQKQVPEVPEAPEGIMYKNLGTQESQNCSLVCGRMKHHRMRWSVSGANNMGKLIYTRQNEDMDNLLQKLDGTIGLPDETDFVESKTIRIPDSVGKGSRYAELIQVTLPAAGSAEPISYLLRKIQNTI